MRKALVCAIALMMLAASAHAAPNATLFGGYQYTRFDGGPNASGWNAAITGGFSSWLGLRADFSAVYPRDLIFTPTRLVPSCRYPFLLSGHLHTRSLAGQESRRLVQEPMDSTQWSAAAWTLAMES